MKEKNIKEKTQQKKKMGLTTKIFVALIAGAILGIILCYLVPDSSFKKDVIVEGILYVIGQGFIRLMKMLVVPLVFCSLVCGSMSIGDTKKLGTVGVRTLVFYLATTALAVSVALTVGNLINPGVGLDMSSIQSSALSSIYSFSDAFQSGMSYTSIIRRIKLSRTAYGGLTEERSDCSVGTDLSSISFPARRRISVANS